MRTNGSLVSSEAQFTNNHKSATYDLLTYDKLTTTADLAL